MYSLTSRCLNFQRKLNRVREAKSKFCNEPISNKQGIEPESEHGSCETTSFPRSSEECMRTFVRATTNRNVPQNQIREDQHACNSDFRDRTNNRLHADNRLYYTQKE